MAVVTFPRVDMDAMTYKLEKPGFVELRGPYSVAAVQLISRGIAYWEGTLTFPVKNAERGDESAEADELMGFLMAVEGGLQEFDIPFHTMQHYKPDRYPSLGETDNASSVQMTDRSPSTSTATNIGYAAEITLDTNAGGGIGLRQGDLFSLHNADLTEHYGLYQCGDHQVGDTVLVAPAPPAFPSGVTSYRLNTRTPTLRARVVGGVPSISRAGPWLNPITIQWRQAA